MLSKELFYEFRALRRAPGFTLLVVLTLALGIATTTAIFSVVYGVLLSPLPFPDSERLVRLCETNESSVGFCMVSPLNALDWSRQSQSFEDLGIARYWPFVVASPSGSEKVLGAVATPEFLQAFLVSPLRGRLLESGDLEPGGHRVAVLSHSSWQSWYGGDPEILGKTLTLDSEGYTIVGVLSTEAEIPGLDRAQFWVPLAYLELEEEHRGWRGFQVVGRLRPEVTLKQAHGEMSNIARGLAQQYPETNRDWGISLVSLRERIVGRIRSTLLVFLGAGLFVLLIACSNVANLLLSRGISRQRELAVRVAVGATRGHLLRHLVIESLLLAFLGGLCGLALAHLLVKVFLTMAPSGIPRLDEVTLGSEVFAFAAIVSLLTSVLFGLIPALRATRPALSQMLKAGFEDLPARPWKVEPRGALVVGEVALALMLSIGAGLMIRSFLAAESWHGGFDHENLFFFSVLCPDGKYLHEDQVVNFFRQAVDELNAIPGVLSASTASAGPLFGPEEVGEFLVEDRPGQKPQAARWFDVGSDYFQTLGVSLLRGRYFTEQDNAKATPVAIVNDTMARRFWSNEDPIGRQVRWVHGSVREVVGVVADVKPLWPESEVEPEIYWPNLQEPRWGTFLVVRSSPDLPGITDTIRTRIRTLDPETSVSEVSTFQGSLDSRLARPQFNMLLLGGFSFVALALALSGTYGVISYAASRRTREIGLRMTLGADRVAILGLMLRQGLKLTGIGVGLGLVGAFALTKVLLSMLYDTQPNDTLTFICVAGLLILTALLASYFPARRATKVDPMTVIRCE